MAVVMVGARIIGIVLVRNEDRFIEQVLRNIIDFCDEIIVADNLSTDGTAAKIRNFCRLHDRISYHRISRISVSHELIRQYAREKVWIFGVDGDEIYDPAGLRILRNKLLSGSYDDCWMIFGNVLHCREFDENRMCAVGHFSPPCRSMTKLYNFRLIESWESSSGERLHGGKIVFRQGFGEELRCELYKELAWEKSPFRCLHMCFLQRSSRQRTWRGQFVPRPNPADILSRSPMQKAWALIRKSCGVPVPGKTEWKVEKFSRGLEQTVDVSAFFDDKGQL